MALSHRTTAMRLLPCACRVRRAPRAAPAARLCRLAALVGLWSIASTVSARQAVDFTHLPALQSPVVTEALLLDVTRAGDRLVAVGENGFVVFSDDEGRSWQQATVPLSVTLTTVAFIDERRGWAGGHEGMLISSTDGGETWTQQFDGVAATRQEIALAQRRLESARERLDEAGTDGSDEAALMLEDAQWALEDLEAALEDGPSKPFMDVHFGDDADTGIAVGAYGYLFRSENAGESWQLTAGSIENPYSYHYYGIAEAADGALFLAGEAGLLYRSVDGGRSWETLDSPYEGSWFGVLTGTAGDGDFVLLFGLRGNVYRSVDEGARWRRIDVGTQASMMAGTTLADGRIVLVGNAGTILVSGDGGRSFSASFREDRNSLSGVAPAGESHVVVVGAGGVDRIPVPAVEDTVRTRGRRN